MMTLVKTELMKLKRSYMFLICVLGSICAPFLTWLIFITNNKDAGLEPDFYEYMIQTNTFIALIIGTLLYGLFTTYVFEREFTEDMYKHLFTVPISKFSLLVSKIIVIMIGILLLTMVSFTSALFFSMLSGFEGLGVTHILSSLALYLKAYIAFIPLMIPVILVTLIFKGFVAAIAFSIVAEIGLFIVSQSEYIALYPWSAPLLMGTEILQDYTPLIKGNVHYTMISIIAIGLVAFIASMIYLQRSETI